MSDATVSLENVKLLINGNLPSNMLSYVAKQAVSGDQVMYWMNINNSVLLQWYTSKSGQKKYVDFLNEVIPNGLIKVKRTSSRIEDRLRFQCSKASKQVKKLNLKGSKAKRVTFLNSMSKVSILASDVVSAAEMEEEIQCIKYCTPTDASTLRQFKCRVGRMAALQKSVFFICQNVNHVRQIAACKCLTSPTLLLKWSME